MKYQIYSLNFSNPHSAEFISIFRVAPSESSLANALVEAADSTEWVGANTVAEVLVAAEIIAASFGRPSIDFPVDLPKVVGTTSPPGAVRCRIVALDAVTAVINSVALSGDFETQNLNIWEASQQNLLNRLA